MGPETDKDIEKLLAASADAFKRDKSSEAEANLNSAIALHPGHPVALYLLGSVAAEQRDWPRAEQRFREALQASDRPEICVGLAQALRMQYRCADAIAFCRQALLADPRDTAALLELARAQEGCGMAAEAETLYRHILARQSEPEALLDLTRLLAKAGRAAEAEHLLRRALAGDSVGY